MALTNDQITAQNFKDFNDHVSGLITNGEHRLTSEELEEIVPAEAAAISVPGAVNFSVGGERKIGYCAVNDKGDYKPFYEQVISGNTPGTVSGEVATGLSGINNVQLCSVLVSSDDFTKNLLSATAISNDGATIAFELPMDLIYFGKKFYATVRYTKTNDTIAGRFEEKKASLVFADSLTIKTGNQTNVLIMTNDDSPFITTSSNTSLVTISNVKDGNSYTSTIKVANSPSDVDRTVEATYRIDQYSKIVNILVPKRQNIYGAEWAGGSSPAWTRTDSAASFADPNPHYNGMSGSASSPFDTVSPWKDLKTVTSSAAGTLVEIPKFYYKWTRNGVKMKLQISMGSFDGSHVSPAHADRGDGVGERDYVYVGKYHCANDNFKSHSGVVPKVNLVRSAFRTSIHNLGANIWQYDYAMYWTIMMLYLVEFANWDSQLKIGYGCGNSSAAENMGMTDSFSYHTGTNTTRRTAWAHVKYRNIEGLWSNAYDWVDGIYFGGTNLRTVFCIKNPANFSDSAGGTNVGTRSNVSGDPQQFTNPTVAGFEYALYPSVAANVAEGQTTYVCDNYSYSNHGAVLYVGGSFARSLDNGPFRFDGSYYATDKSNRIGARLMVLPPSRLT